MERAPKSLHRANADQLSNVPQHPLSFNSRQWTSNNHMITATHRVQRAAKQQEDRCSAVDGACARQQKWLVWAFCIKGGDLNCVLFLGGRRPKISPACFLAHANYKSRGTFAPGCEVVGILSLLVENWAFGGISHHAARPAQAINEEWFGASRRMDVEIRR